jgi:hypothetical protein
MVPLDLSGQLVRMDRLVLLAHVGPMGLLAPSDLWVLMDPLVQLARKGRLGLWALLVLLAQLDQWALLDL